MEEIQQKLDHICELLTVNFEPISIFLYGSRARDDFLSASDYEIGIIFANDKKTSLEKIRNSIREPHVNVYPMTQEELENYNINTPFVKRIFIRDLIQTAKTLHGKKIIENLKPPAITMLDVLESIKFNSGYALGAILAERAGAHLLAATEFAKSNLFGTREYLIAKNKKFPATYDDILNLASKDKNLAPEWKELVKTAYDVRREPGMMYSKLLYDNVTYLNTILEPKVREIYKNKGDAIVLK